MKRQVKQDVHSKLETVDVSEMTQVSGGIWDYVNRLGPFLGQQLADKQDGKYGVTMHPGTLDAAAHQALEGWVSVP